MAIAAPGRRRPARSRRAPTSAAGRARLLGRPADRERVLEERAGRSTSPRPNATKPRASRDPSVPRRLPRSTSSISATSIAVVPASLGPGDMRGHGGHHVAAVGLLDLVGVAQALLEPDLRRVVVHHVRREGGRGPEGGHAGALEPGVARDPCDSSMVSRPASTRPRRTSISPSRKSMSPESGRPTPGGAGVPHRGGRPPRRAGPCRSRASPVELGIRQPGVRASATPGAPRARHRPRRRSAAVPRVVARRAEPARRGESGRRRPRPACPPRAYSVGASRRRRLGDGDVVDRERGLAVRLVELRQLCRLGGRRGRWPRRGRTARTPRCGWTSRSRPRRPPARPGTPLPAGRPARSGPTHGSRCCPRGVPPNSAARAWNVRSVRGRARSRTGRRGGSWWRKSK